MKVIKGLVGMGATVGAAMTGQLAIVLLVMAGVVLVLVLVFFVLRGDDDRPAERLKALIRAWRSRDA